MQVLQITNVTVDEFMDRLKRILPIQDSNPLQVTSAPVKITVLNEKDAAKTLCISKSFFDKLQERGIIPATVNAGFNNKGGIMWRWAEHHLLAIKPVIQVLKHNRNDEFYLEAKRQVNKILGL